MEPWLRARAARAVAALADDDAEGVVPDVVPAQRGGEAGAAAHAERAPHPAAGGPLRRAGLGLGLSPLGSEEAAVAEASTRTTTSGLPSPRWCAPQQWSQKAAAQGTQKRSSLQGAEKSSATSRQAHAPTACVRRRNK